MAKVHARGRKIVGTVEFTATAKRYMSDGVILSPDGNGGWRVAGKLKPGVDPAEACARAVARVEAVEAKYPDLAAYRKGLHDICPLHRRQRLQMIVEMMPDDPDGVWSECCDGYGDNVHADLDDIVQLCRLYRNYKRFDAPRIAEDRKAA